MKKFDSINVIPFIDIMLVLLAIVLTTATFVSNGQLEITLPEASSDTATDATQKTEIAIDDQEILYLDGVVVGLDELEGELAALATETKILLRIDATVPFSEFVSVIDLLKQLELDDVSVLTEKTAAVSAKGSDR